MAFDGIFLSLQIDEILSRGAGARVDKLYQPARDEIVLTLRGRGFSGRLLICARPGTARLHFTEKAAENPAVPPMLCMLLRKKLTGSVLSGISQISLDRVALLEFSGLNELGDPCVHYIAAELTGGKPNIILLDESKNIIDAVHRSSAESARLVMPGAAYQPPPAPSRLNIFKTPVPELIREITSLRERDLHTALRETLEGLSPLVCREIVFRTAGGDEPEPATLTADQKSRLSDVLTLIAGIKSAGPSPAALIRGGVPFEYSFFPILQYNDAKAAGYQSLSGLLDDFYFERDRALRLHTLSRDLSRALSTAAGRTAKKINLRKAELEKCAGREEHRIFGELLKANIHQISRGETVCRVPNYYDPEYAEVSIPLDPALSPAENAQKYFKLYKKANTARQLLHGLIEDGERELEYINTVSDALSRAGNEREIAEIREELTASGYFRKKERRAVKKQPLLPPRKFELEGYSVLVGRNNRQNDELTMKTAGPRDIWLHARNVPGSHVILLCGGKPEPPESVLTGAARLAALHSSIGKNGGGDVDYTLVKYVKKPPGAKPGMVIYERFKTIFVRTELS